MKLLFVIQGMQSGGAERVMSVLCNSLVTKGHSVTLALTENNERYAYKLHPEILVEDFTNPKGTNILKGRLLTIKKIARLCRSEHPDAIISFITRTNICAILAGKISGVPVIVSERNNPWVDPSRRSTRIIRRIIYPFAEGYVFQTRYAMNYFGNYIKGKSTVIYNPVNEEINDVDKDCSRENTIVAICRLNQQKNIPMLINAYKRADEIVPGYILNIYGEGEEEDCLKGLIENQGLVDKVRLQGHTSDPFSVLGKAAIFALASDYEGMPNALIEALCMGCACISTDSPAYGARELIDNHSNGILVPVRDETAFSDALIALMKDKELRESMGEKAKNTINKVDTNTIVNQWIDYIRSRVLDS